MKALGRLSHRNIVRATDAGLDCRTPYLVMERIRGLNLSTLVRRVGPMPIPDACEMMRQAANGLAHLHERGLVHRDIKPSNLMLTAGGEIKILDLGLARMAEIAPRDHSDQTRTGQVMGTIDYMAPEQGTESRHADIRSDIYSLGGTLYKLLTGHAPYDRESRGSLLNKMRTMALSDPQPILQRRGDLPTELAEIVHHMLARDPEQRFDHPEQVAERLQPFCHGATLVALHDRAAGGDTEIEIDSSPSNWVESEPTTATKGRSNRRLVIGGVIAAIAIAMASVSMRPTSQPANNEMMVQSTPDGIDHPFLGFLDGHTDCVFGVEWIDDHRLVSAGWDGTVRVWDVDERRQTHRLDSRGNAAFGCLAVSPDRSMIAACNIGGTIYQWKSADCRFSHAFQINMPDAAVCRLAFSPDGKAMFVACHDGRFEILDAETGDAQVVIGEIGRHDHYSGTFVDNNSVVVGGAGQLRLFDLSSQKFVKSFVPAPKTVSAMSMLADNEIVVCSSWSNLISVWDIRSGRFQDWTATIGIQTVASMPNRQHAAIAGAAKTIRFIDCNRGDELSRIGLPTYSAQRLAVSPNGRLLASGGGWHVADKLHKDGDYRLRIWTLDSQAFDDD
ncbi:MAG: protein kinase [Planctomycetales bacterium]|nr:protein kinase [Planctomycetales bacterium]